MLAFFCVCRFLFGLNRPKLKMFTCQPAGQSLELTVLVWRVRHRTELELCWLTHFRSTIISVLALKAFCLGHDPFALFGISFYEQ